MALFFFCSLHFNPAHVQGDQDTSAQRCLGWECLERVPVGEGARTSLFRAGSVVLLIVIGHLFWECTFPPLVENRENPEFHGLMRMDKGHWSRCLLWHGWLPLLSGVNACLRSFLGLILFGRSLSGVFLKGF